MSENKYKNFSSQHVTAFKESWNKDFFHMPYVIDIEELLLIGAGLLTFLYLLWWMKATFITLLILFYWFRAKQIEEKIIKAKQFLILGARFLDEDFRGRGATQGGVKVFYDGHRRGFKDYIIFLELKRKHLIARMVILNLFALVLLEIIKPK